MRDQHIKNRLELAKYFGKLGFKTGAEIGVKTGRYSEILCQNIPGLKLVCIDTWPTGRIHTIAKKKLKAYDTTLIKTTSMEAAKLVPDESLDFVFIDADHKYESVRDDIREWTKKVRKGGIVSGHDYFVFFYTHNRGVIDAVDEYVKKHNYQLFTTEKDLGVECRDDRQPCWYFFK
jgi:predicted O-methyltransferase YrrM